MRKLTSYALCVALLDKLANAKHGGEEDAVLGHPLQVLVEGHAGSAKGPEVVVRIDDGEEAVFTLAIPADIVVLVALGEAGEPAGAAESDHAALRLGQSRQDRGRRKEHHRGEVHCPQR